MNPRRALRRLASHAENAALRYLSSGVVLAYHRVSTAVSDPRLLRVTPAHFEEHLLVMRELGECVSLRELVQRCAVNAPPRRGIIVTFDDGYADNLDIAAPLLARHDVPATVFVATTGLEEGALFWWDELEALVLLAGELPQEVSVTHHGEQMAWALTQPADSDVPDQPWDVTRAEDPTPRHAAYRSLVALCRCLPGDEREGVLRQLREQLGKATADGHRRLSPAQVAKLARTKGIDVGSHGITHSAFRVLSEEDGRREMEASKAFLTHVTGKAVDLFSFPFGTRRDLTADSVRQARDAGYMAACVNWPGRVWWGTDPYRIPRFQVRDWSEDEFAEHLERWLAGRADARPA